MNKAIYLLREHGYRVFLTSGKGIEFQWEGEGDPDPLICNPLFDEVRANKKAVLAELRAEGQQTRRKVSGTGSKRKSIFNPAHRLPKNVIFATECDEHPNCFVAYRVGSSSPVGHGSDQVEAVLNLADLEEAQEPSR